MRIEPLSSGDTLKGFLLTGTGFEEVMTARLSGRALAYEYDSETLARAYLGHTVQEGTHVLTLAKRGALVEDSVTILRGRDGQGISWRGSLESAPENPDFNWAYHNSLRNTAYIWDSSEWRILIEGFKGVAGTDGISIVWQCTHAASPSSPEQNWAYYNSTDGVSYIYSGSRWDTLAVNGADGAPGADGISIVWKGTSAARLSAPQQNWAYYKSTDGVSYIFAGGGWDTLSISGFDYSNQSCPQGYQLAGFGADGQIICR